MSKRSMAQRRGSATALSGDSLPAATVEGRPMARAEARAGRSARRTRREEIAHTRRRTMLLFGGIPLVLIIAVVAVLIVTSSGGSGLVNADKLNPGTQMLAVGTKAPDFTLSSLEGASYHLAALKGKPVLLEFFAVWCPHCQRESTILNQIDHTFGPKGLKTLAVLASPYGKNYDTSGGNDLSIATKSDVTWFENTFVVAHPTLIDPNFGTVNAYNASSYPTIYVLDTQGVIRYANSGEQPYANLANAVTAASK